MQIRRRLGLVMAGPVYAKAPSKCIDVYGAVGGAGRWLRGVHCG
ncbi:hypothetical protein [Nonomuraea sp. KM88]